MPVEWVDERITGFRRRLQLSDVDDFDEQLEEEISNLDLGEIRDDLENKYRRSEEHLELLKAVASAFHQTPLAEGYSSGYEFAFTEPLEERNSEIVGDEEISNGDVLLVKEDGDQLYLCVIECKSGASGGRDWVNELSEIEEILETDEYREILKSQLGAQDHEIRHIQYILLGMTTQVLAMNYDSISEQTEIPPNYAFWGYSPGEQKIVNIHGEVRDSSLMGVISDSIDTGKVANPIEFTFGDHSLTQLQTVIDGIITTNLRDDDPHPFEFNRFDFRQKFEAELQVGFGGDLKEQLVNHRVNYLLELGVKSEIFVDSLGRINSGRGYRIYFRGRTPKAAKDSAKHKYFEWRSVERRKEKAFELVREEFDALPPQATLDEERFRQDDDYREGRDED